MDLLLASAAPAGYSDGVQPDFAEGVDEQMYESLKAGIACLRSAGLSFLGWVEQVIRQILVLRAEPTRTKSGSRSHFPGLVHMSLPEGAHVVAENLMHEASHQYYHLLLRIGPIHTGEDTALYYSPAVGRPRPLDRLVLAFHAFGNVALLYHRLLEIGFATRESRSQLDRLGLQLEQLRAPMVGNPALTLMGSEFIRPLNVALVGRGIISEVKL
ncbi:aKG-HExxH-type peptide beta-hydroxylase [Kitasatospora sp. NPDC017646]|uniref:aKG-HExxH-type peptide beta-hydroxylase n=1 Tax=Kitasatospora sp. NPDC017646 TaxID=3364024 RepID=UPI0037AEBED0